MGAKRKDGLPKGTLRADNKGAHPGVMRARPLPQGGQPAIIIDESNLYAAAETHASYIHLGEIFGVSAAYLKEHHEALITKARAEKKKALLAAQFQAAIGDRNPTMQIWLGKQYLEQTDVSRTEHSGPGGKPIQTEKLKRVVAYYPDNQRRRAENVAKEP